MIDKINIREKLARFTSRWDPKIVAELNGQHVKLVKFEGPFIWHRHEDEDELFLVVEGEFVMEFRDGSIPLQRGRAHRRAARHRAQTRRGEGSPRPPLRACLDGQHRRRGRGEDGGRAGVDLSFP